MLKHLFVVLALATLAACASELTESGNKVLVATALTASDAEKYAEIGPVEVQEDIEYAGDEESCRNRLRNAAGAAGADVVLVEGRERKPCLLNKEQSCLHMTGRAYRKKTP